MARRVRSSPASSIPVAPVPLDPPVSRREWIAVAALVLLAAGLRFAFPGRMAVEHFDEGVYASNIFFTAEEGGQYPYRHLYAPPLLPFLIEWGIIFLGPQSIAPFLPALILGTATVPLAWWAARCWFGPASGLAAALLVATSDFHLLYSRTALTDVPVAFFLLLAVYLYWEAARRESLRWAVFAGVATGLAWWTKYTGWLPLAITASGSAAWVLFERRAGGVSPPRRAKLVTKLFAATAVTAFAVWSPVPWGLQQYGGYAAVAENHRGYLRPLSQWGINAWEQAGNLAAQSGLLTVVSLSAVTAIASLGWRKPPWLVVPVAAWCALVTGWAALETGPATIIALTAGVGLGVDHFSALRAHTFGPTNSSEDSSRRLAAWFVTAWLVGMFVTTPFYHPYPRLAMPWLLAALLGTTVWMTERPWAAGARAALPVALLLLPAAVFVEQALPSSWHTTRWSVPAWKDRSGLRNASSRIAQTFRREHSRPEPAVVYVYTEHSDPAVFFHAAAMMSSERTAVVPAGDYSFVDRPSPGVTCYAITTVLAINARPQEEARAVAEHLWKVGNQAGQGAWEPSGITYLDRGRPYYRDLASGVGANSMWPQIELVRIE